MSFADHKNVLNADENWAKLSVKEDGPEYIEFQLNTGDPNRDEKNPAFCRLTRTTLTNQNFEASILENTEEAQEQVESPKLKRQKSGVMINAGFFDFYKLDFHHQDFNPLTMKGVIPIGDLIINGERKKSLPVNESYRDDYGVFAIKKDGTIELLSLEQLQEGDDKIQHALSSGPVLIKNNQIMHNGKEDRFPKVLGEDPVFPPGDLNHAEQPNPRSAIGWNDRYLYNLTIGGKDGARSGLKCSELAELCNQIGMNNALNLDGGSSSVLKISSSNENQPKTLQDGGRKPYISLWFNRKTELEEEAQDQDLNSCSLKKQKFE